VRDDVPVEEVTRDLERLSHEAQAADQPALAAAVLKAQDALSRATDPDTVASARGELSEALVDFVATSTEPSGFSIVSAPVPLEKMAPITLIEDFEHDDEMREIFLEEAREVVDTIVSNLAACREAPHDREALTTIRRGFHTLKGSGRMVGLMDLGEMAWQCEQVMNKWLKDEKPATPELLSFTELARESFSGWVAELKQAGTARIDGAAITRQAEALKSGEAVAAAAPAEPAAQPQQAAAAQEMPPLEALVIETPSQIVAQPVAEAARAPHESPAPMELTFESLELGSPSATPLT